MRKKNWPVKEFVLSDEIITTYNNYGGIKVLLIADVKCFIEKLKGITKSYLPTDKNKELNKLIGRELK